MRGDFVRQTKSLVSSRGDNSLPFYPHNQNVMFPKIDFSSFKIESLVLFKMFAHKLTFLFSLPGFEHLIWM